MTDLLDEQHARVALDLLAANPVLEDRVFDGVVPSPTPRPPYILVYTSINWTADDEAAGSSLGHEHLTCVTTWYLHCVGETAAAARAMTMQARASLLDKDPLVTPTGRACTRIREDDANTPTRDESLGYPVMDAVLVLSMTSVPG
ncbi:MAG TPA: hypothetical protein VF163_21525 [Micromonosporaceae bacterium]